MLCVVSHTQQASKKCFLAKKENSFAMHSQCTNILGGKQSRRRFNKIPRFTKRNVSTYCDFPTALERVHHCTLMGVYRLA